MTPPLYTIGHSNQPVARLLEVLAAHGIRTVVDIRTVPRSRHNPQFSQEALRGALSAGGVGYRHLPPLGGLRKPSPTSENLGWREPGFRGFADHMSTPEFADGLAELETIARADRTAIMCAEAMPRRCHRAMVADALTVGGWRVLHIGSDAALEPHELTPFLSVHSGRLTYPPPLWGGLGYHAP